MPKLSLLNDISDIIKTIAERTRGFITFPRIYYYLNKFPDFIFIQAFEFVVDS